jgi:hypothetical protein
MSVLINNSGKQEKKMNQAQIMTVFRDLAKSQGLYGRILESITQEQLYALEQEGFSDAVELVMFIEC